ncbi:MAG: hypothetical protein JL50_00580 [Peptococcaceae bacterium BICA1-7]|nr:MAG: hypothetical protein JL50_00580 [Peptococcaceae bacterium BICA1-7]HBV98117.1 hypothetical protein [Desulfotomaculum sp.]
MYHTARSIALILLMALALAPGNREALGSFIAMSREEVFARSDLVVLGRATLAGTVEINRPDGNGTMIYRDYSFKIQKTFKGNGPVSDITVRIPGGTHNGSTMVVTVAVELNPDKDQVLFLIKKPGEKIYSTFHPLGVFTVSGHKVSNPEEALEMVVFAAQMDEYKNKYGNGLLLKAAHPNTPAAAENADEGMDLRRILTVVAPALIFLSGAALRRKYARETGGPGPM